MTDDVPPLPETDDPHELLGVDSNADEGALKRAYFGLIKVYRPDRHAEEFQRVRRAYEQALMWLEYHAFQGDAEEGDDEEAEVGDDDDSAPEPVEPAELSPGAAAAWERWRDVWREVRDGDPDAVARRLERETTEDPAEAVGWQLRHLLAEWRGEDAAAAGEFLIAGLEAGAPISDWILTVLEHDVLRIAPRLTWPVLSGQLDRDAAVRLFDAHIAVSVTHGTSRAVLDQILEPRFLEIARHHDGLRWLGLRVAIVTAFVDPERADEVFERLAREPMDDGSPEHAFLTRRRLRQEWGQFGAMTEATPELRAFLESCHSIHPHDLVELGLIESVRHRPDENLAAFDALVAGFPGLYHLFLEGVELCFEESGHEEEVDATVAAERFAAFVMETDRALEKDKGNRFDSVLGGVLVVGTVLVFIRFGWWGLVPTAVALVWIFFNVSRVDRRLYRDIVRPRALREVVRRGATTTDLVVAIKKHTRLSDDIGRFDGELTEDHALHAVALALRTDPHDPVGVASPTAEP